MRKIFHRSVMADLLTPVSAYLHVAAESERAFLLESVEGGEKIGRFSFIGVDPEKSFEGSFDDFRASFPAVRPPHPDLPPFAGGAVGSFAYDMVWELERLPGPPPDSPSVLMDFYSTILAFDHLRHRIIIMSQEGEQRVKEIEERLRSPMDLKFQSGYRLSGGNAEPEEERQDAGPPKSNFSSADFQAAVLRAQEYIRAGDVFQVVLSQRFEADYTEDPFNVYRALRYINPSPYMFFLKRVSECIVGSSPEMLLRVQANNLEYRPIAGTRRRGRNRDEEKHLEEELMTDAKERAEHLMLVDLGRNDLGRVSEYGGVRLEGLMFLEKYSHVMHLVSSLRGKLRAGLDRFDALAACFPAGTVSGAPKIRAMEIIDELEPDRRGIYAGAIGYLDYSGNLDTCIAIRTVILREGKALFQAGAGIVADSVPELEDKECWNKARVLAQALELAREL